LTDTEALVMHSYVFERIALTLNPLWQVLVNPR
jgi:hypothetical protein